jgi:hypothetical protein
MCETLPMDVQEFHVVFSSPDDQWIPTVVIEFVIAILTQLNAAVRTILVSTIHYFQTPAAPAARRTRGLPAQPRAVIRNPNIASTEDVSIVHARIVTKFTQFGQRISQIMMSIVEQMAIRLMRQERTQSLHTRLRIESVKWSWLLAQADVSLVTGECAANPSATVHTTVAHFVSSPQQPLVFRAVFLS